MDTTAPRKDPLSRRNFLGVAAAALSASALAQSRSEITKGEQNHSASNPGPVNPHVAAASNSSELPPVTDHGDVSPFWYSFDLSHRRIQDGGWTRQVTKKEISTSLELAGVNMRLTAGSYRELHWHTADEWAYMIYGNARVTLLNPDGTIFIDDITEGDLWYFPAGFPHSIQGLGPDGCEFLLVFDDGAFSEYETFLISDWVAHTPPDVLAKNFRLPESALANLPREELYIFPGTVPGPLEDDRKAVGGKAVASKIAYTFHTRSMKPTNLNDGGEVRVIDSHVFEASKQIAAAIVRIKPGGLRELHWHPSGSEWQYWISGSGRMTVFEAGGKARTMSFNANDVGFLPSMAGHFIENTGTEDLVYLEMFRTATYVDVALNKWIRSLPHLIMKEHLHLDEADLEKIPNRDSITLPK